MQEPSPSLSGYRFGVFEVDLRAGEIRKNGLKIKLQEQPFQVLTFLLQNSPNLVAREDLRKRLWDADTFVEFDHGLSNAIGRIREALGDSADNARFIETLPKRGYRFIVPVEELLAARVSSPPVNGAKSNGAHSEDRQREVNHTQASGDHAKTTAPWRRVWPRIAIYAAGIVMLAAMFGARARRTAAPKPVNYTQVTNFSDVVFSPAISPDGRMIAFIRGSDTSFPTLGEIYIKMLPDGEPVQLTHDSLPKYGVSFSPDGSQITYTLSDLAHGWSVVTISALGGEPRLLLSNAAGLTWLDAHHVLFSEIKTGLHMGLVMSTDDRSELRDIYLPEHERGMVHYSYASPDRKWVLIVEMGPTGGWQRCRLLPLDGRSAGSPVGPPGPCTSAAWSPDGSWMYFSAYAKGSSHLWRQPFPNGEAEQITSGPADEAGIAVSRDGRSVISSVGMNDSGVWLHDSRGDRLISSEGYASLPSFSRDGRSVYYLLRRESPESPQELWVTEIASGKSEPVVQGFSVRRYDVSSDGKEVVFEMNPPDRQTQLWLASLDRLFPPRMLASSGEDSPFFGPDGEVIFRMSEGKQNYLFRMKRDGSGRTKLMSGPIINLGGTSPDGRWAVATLPVDEVPSTAVFAVPVQGGSLRRICPAACMAKWSSDGTRFYVQQVLQGARGGNAVVLPVPRGKSLPDLPVQGIRSEEDSAALPGSKVIEMSRFNPSRFGNNVAPGPAIDTFAYARAIVHRNLFQIPLP
jgi:Tol biopolymer transport system component/DNA-binding winged helix-turn-helix (wHTH) protein